MSILAKPLFCLTESSSKLYGEDESSSTLTRTEVECSSWRSSSKRTVNRTKFRESTFYPRFSFIFYFSSFFQANDCFSMAPPIQSKLRIALCNCISLILAESLMFWHVVQVLTYFCSQECFEMKQ